jgi:disulfide bond formation protein DsbB
MSFEITPERIAMALGGVALALILGALGFEYIGGYPPCEMCMWQRWPHYAAIVVGLGGGLAVWRGNRSRREAIWAAELTMVLVAISGVIGVYHAGVEWHVWAGPQACTGGPFQLSGALDLNARVVMCDVAAWRLFGISMAGYNALISLGSVGLAGLLLMWAPRPGAQARRSQT